MRPVIHSTKHYVQMSLFQVATVARVNTPLIVAVAVPDKNTVFEVEEGAIVKAIYVELWLENTSNLGSEVVILTKTTAGSVGPSFAEIQALGDWDEKKNILFTHQGLSANDSNGPPIAIMRGWYKIPKSKQRFGLGDQLNLSIGNPSLNDLNACGFATYKEYT